MIIRDALRDTLHEFMPKNLAETVASALWSSTCCAVF